MILFDFINDEAPLFAEGIKELISTKALTNEMVLGITEGRRWYTETQGLNCLNRLHYFDKLDTENIDLSKELKRISSLYDSFNIYACDRYLTKESRSLQVKFLVYTFLFYEDVFQRNITHYFTTGIAYSYNLISYQVAQRHGVKHISFYGTRIGNKTCISLDVSNSFDEVNSRYAEYKPELVEDKMYLPITEFVQRPKQPSYMKNAINASTIKGIFIKEFFIRFKRYYLNKKHRYDLFTRSPFELSSFKLKKIINAKKIDLLHNHIFDSIDYNDKYFIFPLHMQPEASTLILAPFNVDQKTTVLSISKLLTPDTLLYVKEHRSALGQHSLSFYREIKKYPNIRLISYREDMFELIKNSRGTINLSSTVGLEALMLKKPSITLGNVFYNKSGLTFMANSYPELGLILDQLGKELYDAGSHFEQYDAKLAYFIYCLNLESYDFEFNVAKLDTKKRVMKASNIKGFANCIERLLADG